MLKAAEAFCSLEPKSGRLQTVRQPGLDQPPVEPAGLDAILGSIKNALAAQHDFLLSVTLPGMRRQAAGASLGQQTAPLSVQAGGFNPRRLAIILSTMRFGSTAVIKCRIGSGVIW